MAKLVAAVIVAAPFLVLWWAHRERQQWDERTFPRRRKVPTQPPVPRREDRRCQHPACGSQVVPSTFTSDGVATWRCIGCQTEYVA